MLNFTTPSATTISNEARRAMNKYVSGIRKSNVFAPAYIGLARTIKMLLQSEGQVESTKLRSYESDIQKEHAETVEQQYLTGTTSAEDTQLLGCLTQYLGADEIQAILSCWKPIVEECLNVFAQDIKETKLMFGAQPKELAGFVMKMLNPADGSIIYNPFFGMGGYAISAPNNKFVGEEYNIETAQLSWLRMAAADVCSEIKWGDSFIELSDPAQSYDYIVFTPPFGMGPKGRSEADAIMLALDRLKEGGTMAVVVPAGFTFHAYGRWAELKKELVDNHLLKAVISLPPVFQPYTSVATCVILIKKEEGDSFVAVDGTRYSNVELSDLFAKIENDITTKTTSNVQEVRYDELENLDLTPSKLTYKIEAPSGTKLYRLGDLMEFSSRQSIKGPFIEVLSDCTLDYLNCTQDEFMPEREGEPLKRNRRVYQTSILIDPCENGLRVGRMSELDNSKDYFVTIPATMVGTIKESAKNIILFDYMLKALTSEFMVQQVRNAMYGVVSYSIKDEDYPNLLIPIPSIERQREELNADLKESIKDTQAELAASLEDYKREIHMRKHALSQTFSGLDARWQRLVNYAKRNGGIIKLDDVIGVANQVSVKELLDVISDRLSTVANQIVHLADDNHDWGEPEDIDPQKLLEDFQRSNISTDFKIVLKGQENSNSTCIQPFFLENGKVRDSDVDARSIFRAPVAAVKQVLNNILSNARDHGFIDSARSDYEVVLDWGETEDLRIWITIANNGAPLKDGIHPSDVLTYGFSTNLNEGNHAGLGGSDSKAIMSRYGSIEVIADKTSKYHVIYKLIFNETNNHSLYFG